MGRQTDQVLLVAAPSVQGEDGWITRRRLPVLSRIRELDKMNQG
jgi:hypothetical protein